MFVMLSIVLRLLLLPLVASFLPYLACELFNSNRPRGLLSFDILLFVLLFSLDAKQIRFRAVVSCFAIVLAIVGGSVEHSITLFFYLTFIWLPIAVKKYLVRLALFATVALIVLVCDAGVFFYNTFAMSMADAWGVAKFFWWGVVLFFAVPCVQILIELLFARNIVAGVKAIKISPVAAVLLITVVLAMHLGVGKLQNRQPILEFSIKEYAWQLANPDVVGHNPTLQEDMKAAVPQINLSEIKVDFSKPTVMILVESWGVNKNVDITKALLAPYNAVTNKTVSGIGLRTESFTQGAEFEDFETNQEQTVVQRFKQHGFTTMYLHGYAGNFYKRNENYQKYGFDEILFKEDFERKNLQSCKFGFSGICDSSIAHFIDTLLEDPSPKFIYWTTLDGHLPYEGQILEERPASCDLFGLSEFECVYFARQEKTARYIAALVKKHPDVNFIVRGDHRPPGSVVHPRFSANYYYRWVPIVIVTGKQKETS